MVYHPVLTVSPDWNRKPWYTGKLDYTVSFPGNVHGKNHNAYS